MEDFALLGNAAAVPIIMGVTQLLKSNFSFKYKADVVSFFVAMVICPAWWLYNTPEVQVIAAFSDGIVASIKIVMNQGMIAVATWFSATKSYDLLAGNKKRADKHTIERQVLETNNDTLSTRITELENGTESGGTDALDGPNEVDAKLSEILEGR